MNSRPLAVLEKVLAAGLIASFALPLLLGLFLRLSPQGTHRSDWLRNASLVGVDNPVPVVSPDLANVFSAKYQAAAATQYDGHFPAREFFIRVANEINLRLFSASSTTVVGRDRSLFLESYLREYCVQRTSADAFREEARQLRQLQDACAAHKVAFALMVTPNKAAVYPEDLPAGWRGRFNAGPRYYDALVAALRENGVHYVDGAIIVAGLKGKTRSSLFPQGGIHWTDEAALATGNALLATLAAQGLPAAQITDHETRLTTHPLDGTDRDLAELLNVAIPFEYPVAEITVHPSAAVPPPPKPPNIVFVGGSFDWKILRMLDDSRQFQDVNFLDYYVHSQRTQADGKLHFLAMPTPPIDFASEIFAADALVLELNQEAMPNRDGHIALFLKDALSALPKLGPERVPFRHIGQEPYQWGQPLSLTAGKNPIRLITGFAEPTPEGTYTDGAVSTIRLATPPATADMKLEMTGNAFVADARRPEQEAAILINDVPVGQAVWKSSDTATQTLLIPKELLPGGVLRLQFQVARPISLADLGFSTDPRKPGIRFSSIRFVPVGEGDGGGIYHWGETLSFARGAKEAALLQLTGFTEANDFGALTAGQVATVQFTAVSPATDLVLSVNAGAFLVDTRLPKQTATVYLNGHALGEWTWTNSALSLHELPVPKAFLKGISNRLEFRMAKVSSVAELGMGDDKRQFGILVSSIRWHEAGK